MKKELHFSNREDGNNVDIMWFTRTEYLMRYFCVLILMFCCGCLSKGLIKKEPHPSEKLNLPVIETRDRFIPYHQFCQRFPNACDLSGESSIELTPGVFDILSKVNTAVNFEIVFRLDSAQYMQEDFWTFPSSGFGDCEDIALEKRARLVAFGFPRGALRLAIVHHKKNLTTHVVLTLETNKGTYVMDTENDPVRLWYLTPYNFETRERSDNKWDRFDQNTWNYTD